MTFWDLAELPLEQFRPGILSRAEIGKNLIMVCMEIEKEMEDSGHSHPFDQCGMVFEGVMEMFIGNTHQMLKAGMCYFIPAGEQHGWKTFTEAVKILDVSLKPSDSAVS